jgi:signal transduction histidine kinase
MTVAVQALPAVEDSAQPRYRDSARCLLRLERDGCPRLISASKPLAALFERKPEEITARSAAGLFGLSDAALAELMQVCLRRKDAIETDLTLPRNGMRHSVRLILMPQPGDGGDAAWDVLALLADLPEASQARSMPVAGMAGSDLLVRYSHELVVRGCSVSYAALYDRTPAEMVGRNLAEWLPPDELAIVRQAVQRTAGDEIVNTNQVMRVSADGQRRWYRWIDVALQSEMLSIGMDITKLKRAKARLRDAIESINEGFCLFDKDGRLVMFNEQFRAMYPKSAPAIYPGVSMTEMLRYSAASGELGAIDNPAQFAEEVRRNYEANPELRYQRQLADGRWILVSQRRTSDGGYVGLRTDITSVKENEAALHRATDELERKNAALSTLADELREARTAADESNRAKSRFLAHMSHELRTPLSGIIGFSDIMRAGLFGPIEPERYRDYVDLIHNSGALLLSLINDILDMSKIEAGKMELSILQLETRPLAESCRSMVIGMARDSSVAVKVEIDPDCTEVHADERAVKQLIINLMSNAVKFTPAGGVVTLRFRNLGPARGKNGGVAISITDTGIGMTPEELAKAMLPFGQVDSELARQRKGTGIGLTLVKSLAELHGGTLDLASEKGKGTTATITLPWMKTPA